jgi:hypothetical protein
LDRAVAICFCLPSTLLPRLSNWIMMLWGGVGAGSSSSRAVAGHRQAEARAHAHEQQAGRRHQGGGRAQAASVRAQAGLGLCYLQLCAQLRTPRGGTPPCMSMRAGFLRACG